MAQRDSLHTTLTRPDSAFDLARLQGTWSVEQYLRLTDQSNQLIEFTDGTLEVLPVPTRNHQAILKFLLFAFARFVEPRGVVFFSPLRLMIRPGAFREPDLLVLRDAADPRNQNAYWLGADLVVEVVSPDDPERDTVVKRADYAEAGIAEYWIVNPLDHPGQPLHHAHPDRRLPRNTLGRCRARPARLA